ncbi:type II secretion system inner membrane protein GspF [Stenotrophomonas maltophilia]|jgi:general secretion pathway protein F|uniref:type II secretion system inner membrane protein GspF n=1 Tax=Stenotrophomonas geniculata TaxID=86188 RepID=UPI00066CCD3D|nr:type II secretion system inner membrane protein GspF [Stenotrophomonas geniculata]MBH1487091.1 type II secretion system inner membrane protein GspF [Stenotrophomonas maltophilia]MBH1804552.1 type II secretion system inner membrane protein GspF [Stenotrophomonas maltophilia]MBN5138572.1 type II secretion system inner membrane protein GspF [Stenotrophomonas maltophilia]MDH7551290.1 type II secretion system inner membrane protein GspF [Stenotrophomonas geniculata]
MALFDYQAANAQGRIEKGQLDADSPRGARQLLRGRGLTPVQVSAARSAGSGWGARRLSASELAWATRQLASLLAASLPLEGALSAVIEQAERPHVAQALTAVRADVRAGQRLTVALAARPRDFPPIYRALVGAGEDSGDLARVMERLADYIEERNALQAKVLTAFIYPAAISLVSVAIVIFLLSYVVPQVVTAFVQARQTLPMLTQVMLAASAFVRSWGVWVGLGIAALVVAWRLALRRPELRLRWDALLLRVPMIGRFVLGVNSARFASTLAILLDAGVPLLRALEAARQTLGNALLARCADDVSGRVREGAALGSALKVQKVYPPILVHLVASGEKTGSLAPLLDRAAQTISREIERRAMALTALLEPTMILVMGGVVLTIVLAVLMPIMEMNQLVQ